MAGVTDARNKYRLSRNFAVACLIVLAVAGAIISKLNVNEAEDRLVEMAEHHNIDLAKVFATALWPRYGALIDSARALGADAVRQSPETRSLGSDALNLMLGTNSIKIKIYDLSGFTAFSTDLAQIGADYSTNPRFLATIATGASSLLEYRESFAAPERPRSNIWLLSSYVLFTSTATGEPAGVFEIYSDVTALHAAMEVSLLYEAMVVDLAFLAIFVLLALLVWRADRIITRTQERNLMLAASAAKAETANQAKSQFLANMSHELRTPLNAIIGFAEIIKSEMLGPVGTAAYGNYAGDIHTAGRHLLTTINDVLDLARVESGQEQTARDVFDVRDAIDQVIAGFAPQANEKEQKLKTDHPDQPLIVAGDQDKLRHVLGHLLSNAVKFTPPKGTIRVATAQGVRDTIVLTVSDTGIGMREEDFPVALSPFGQIDGSLSRRFEGTGLGLTLAHKYVELMGGTLEITSTLNQGTTVTVILPGTLTAANTAAA